MARAHGGTKLLLLLGLSGASRATVVHGPNGLYATMTTTLYSDPITLSAGQISNEGMPFTMPAGAYAVTEFHGDVVYADSLMPVPLSEVYNRAPPTPLPPAGPALVRPISC